jgi:hypothetical protein
MLVVVAKLLISRVSLSAGALTVMVEVFWANSALKHDGKVFKSGSTSENIIPNSHDFSPSKQRVFLTEIILPASSVNLQLLFTANSSWALIKSKKEEQVGSCSFKRNRGASYTHHARVEKAMRHLACKYRPYGQGRDLRGYTRKHRAFLPNKPFSHQ